MPSPPCNSQPQRRWSAWAPSRRPSTSAGWIVPWPGQRGRTKHQCTCGGSTIGECCYMIESQTTIEWSKVGLWCVFWWIYCEACQRYRHASWVWCLQDTWLIKNHIRYRCLVDRTHKCCLEEFLNFLFVLVWFLIWAMALSLQSSTLFPFPTIKVFQALEVENHPLYSIWAPYTRLTSNCRAGVHPPWSGSPIPGLVKKVESMLPRWSMAWRLQLTSTSCRSRCVGATLMMGRLFWSSKAGRSCSRMCWCRGSIRWSNIVQLVELEHVKLDC